MSQNTVPVHKPRWYWVPVRIALITFLFTLLTFAVCLFLGILGVAISSGLHGINADMAWAYRHFAFPIAISVAAIVLISATIMEIRRYRQVRALAGIARASS